MTFALANFNPVGGVSKRGKAPALWTYMTTDSLATCQASGYFNTVAYMLSIGDHILVEVVDSVSAPTAVSAYGRLLVKSNSAGVVDCYDAHEQGVVHLTTSMADSTNAGQAYAVSPIAGIWRRTQSVMHGTIANADSVFTMKIGGTAVDNTLTLAASGSAAGVVDSVTHTGNYTIAVGSALECETNAGGDTGPKVDFTLTLVRLPADVD